MTNPIAKYIKEYNYWLNEINDIDFIEDDFNIFLFWYFRKYRECQKYDISY